MILFDSIYVLGGDWAVKLRSLSSFLEYFFEVEISQSFFESSGEELVKGKNEKISGK